MAAEPLSALVAEAYEIGGRTKLDPTLILAIMAIESNFNPFAQSAVGAQGLMQVMTTVHTEKYQNFGGHFAAFDPVSNLRVGVKVLQECIARAGSIEGGLRYYVGAANLPDDGGYTAKVMAEHARLKQVASGRSVPLNAPTMLSTQAPATPAQATPPPRATRLPQQGTTARSRCSRPGSNSPGQRATKAPPWPAAGAHCFAQPHSKVRQSGSPQTSATLRGYATGDRRKALTGVAADVETSKNLLLVNHWGACRKVPRLCVPPFAWAALVSRDTSS